MDTAEMNPAASSGVNISNITLTEIDELLHKVHVEKGLDHLPLIVLLTISAVVGIIGNIFTIIFYSIQTKKTPTNTLIKYLAVFDLITCFLMFTTISDLFVNINFTNNILCKIMYFCDHWIVVSSVYILCIISIDRYRRMCKPLAKQFSTQTATIAAVTVSVISMLWSTHDFVTYSPVKINISTSDARIPVVTGHYCTNTDEPSLQTVVTVFHILDAIAIFTVFVVFVYTYGHIWRTVRKHNQKMAFVQETQTIQNNGNVESNSNLPTRLIQVQSNSSFNQDTSHSEVEQIEWTGSTNNVPEVSSVNFSLGSDIKETPVSSLTDIKDSRSRDNISTKRKRSKASLRSFNLERNLSIMMFVVSVGFAVCFTPYFIVNFVLKVGSDTTEDELNTGIEFALRCPFWNGVINPIIFCVFNSKYRKSVKEMFTKCRLNKVYINTGEQ